MITSSEPDQPPPASAGRPPTEVLFIALTIQQILPVLPEVGPLGEAVEALISEAEKCEPDRHTIDCFWELSHRYLARLASGCEGGPLVFLLLDRMA